VPGRPLRIAFVASAFPPEVVGGGRYHVEYARRLRARGHALRVFTWGEVDERTRAADARLPFEVHRAPPVSPGPLLDPSDLAAWLSGGPPEVVLVSRCAPRLREGVEVAARFAPLVLSLHGLGERRRWPSFVGRWRERRRHGLHCARRIVVDSEEAGRRVAALRPRAPITVVHPGIDTVAFTPFAYRRDRARDQLGLGTRRVLLTVSERSRDGHARVIDALPALRARFPDLLHLAVAGESQRAALETRAAERGVADLVRVEERADDTRPYYVACDVFVMASDGSGDEGDEGLDLSCVEAGACGAPLVASPSAAEMVVDGETGCVVDTADPARLADAISGLLAEPVRGRRLAEAGRRHCARFDWERGADALERVLREAADLARA
jgi:glycosyltransferase involved in cell wall biosynthesis